MASLLKTPAIPPATSDVIKKLAEDLGLDINDSEIPDYTDIVNELLKTADVIHSFGDNKLEVKYPRTSGTRPAPADNPYNAWYVKTEIKGAASGILLGKRVVVKDNISVAGIPMMNGSRLLEGHIPDEDAIVVTRVLDAGAIVVGKAVNENLCCSGNSFTAATGPVKNPYDPTLTSGGSTSGCAVLVATGEADMAIAADQGGSIRIPSSWCGIVGLKPTFGLVPYTGALSMYQMIDYIGPMARTVHDCALLLQAMAGEDGLDARQRGLPSTLPNYSEKLEEGVTGIKIAVLKEGFDMCTEDIVKTTVKNALDKLKTAGCEVTEVSVPYHTQLPGPILANLLHPAMNELMRRNGVAPGSGNLHGAPSVARRLTLELETKSPYLIPSSKISLLYSEVLKKRDNFITFEKAYNLVPRLRKAYDDVLSEHDIIILPTLTSMPPKLPTKPLSVKENIQAVLGMVHSTAPFNLSGHPALTINAGNTSDNLPVGMMIVGRHFDEPTVFRVARAYEKISGK